VNHTLLVQMVLTSLNDVSFNEQT